MQNKKLLFLLAVLSVCFLGFSQSLAKESKPSLFSIEGTWSDQDGKDFVFSSLRGKMTVLAMVYTSCDYSCPLITQKMKLIHRKISKKSNNQTKFLLITFDPKRDTSDVFKKYSVSQKLDESSFSLLTSSQENTHSLAVAIGFRYKKMENGHFSHSNQIVVLNKIGEIVLQQDIGKSVDNIVEVIQNGTQ